MAGRAWTVSALPLRPGAILTEREGDPLRWEFEVLDERGMRIRDEAGAYRVRLRGDGEGAAEEWLTDWLPAMPIATMEHGVRYQAVLLRSQIPALGTVRGVFEIEFRGADLSGLETVSARACWEHVPLAAPLEVVDVGEVVGPESLHAANLDPGNNLAPLLNGVRLEEGRGVMEFTLRNGTAEPVYTRLRVEQSVATYLKSWQKANAMVTTHGQSDCLGTGECSLEFRPIAETRSSPTSRASSRPWSAASWSGTWPPESSSTPAPAASPMSTCSNRGWQ